MRPAIILTQQFKRPSNQKVGKYIDYIDRSDAQRNRSFKDYNFVEKFGRDDYTTYMSNPEKTSGLFTDTLDRLTEAQRQQLKEHFNVAQENGSPLWQTVFSFDNSFLIKNNIYNAKTQDLDEHRVMHAVRVAMAELKCKEQLNDTLVWTAAIHYNTDNIHVHIGMMEQQPSRELMEFRGRMEYRGKMKQSSLEVMKSKFIHQFMDRTVELNHIQQLVRERLTRNIITFDNLTRTQDLMKRLNELYTILPDDKRLWRYKMTVMTDKKHLLDSISYDLMRYHDNSAYHDLMNALAEEEHLYHRLYGTGSHHRFEEYKQNKLDELYARAGNMILKELKHWDKYFAGVDSPHIKSMQTFYFNNKDVGKAIDNLTHMLTGITQDYLSQMTYEREQQREEWMKEQQNKNERYF